MTQLVLIEGAAPGAGPHPAGDGAERIEREVEAAREAHRRAELYDGWADDLDDE